jgi:hypothetical protein
MSRSTVSDSYRSPSPSTTFLPLGLILSTASPFVQDCVISLHPCPHPSHSYHSTTPTYCPSLFAQLSSSSLALKRTRQTRPLPWRPQQQRLWPRLWGLRLECLRTSWTLPRRLHSYAQDRRRGLSCPSEGGQPSRSWSARRTFGCQFGLSYVSGGSRA